MNVLIDGKNIYDCSREQLRELNKMIAIAFDVCTKKEALSFTPGTKVSFDANKRGRGKIIGHITKINGKSVTVKPIEDGPSWNVSPALLTRED